MNVPDPIDVLVRLRRRHPRFRREAYPFLLDALQDAISRLPESRHVTGREVVEGARRLALSRFGPLARTVLEHWGITRTEHLGEVVFALVDEGVLVKRDQDRIEDFQNVFDFEEAFERDYPWTLTR